MLKLRRLKIHEYRGVLPGVELRFSDGINILLGKNGTGKTTLLNLISMIVRWDLSELMNEAFRMEFDLALEMGEVQGSIENIESKKQPTSPPVPGASPRSFEAKGDFKIFDLKGACLYDVKAEGGVSKIRTADGWVRTVPNRGPWPMASVFQDTLLTDQGQFYQELTTLWQRAHRFDESLGIYDFITREPDTRLLATHFKSGAVIPGGQFQPLALYSLYAKRSGSDTAPWSVDESSLPFLQALAEEMGFDRIEMHLDVIGRRQDDMAVSLIFSNVRFSFLRAGGELIPQEWLSYGQKRLLSFIYYLACNPTTVIADELVNGLHHSWIEFCMGQLGQRQAFLTSQNPLLFDYVPFHSPEEVKERFVLCSLEPAQDSRPRMRWHQMTDEQAVAFYDAYDAGIEHVGEILRTRGLW